MKYTYEFLRKCHGLRFKAVRCGSDIEGIVKVEKGDDVTLCYGEEMLGNADHFHRSECAVITPGYGLDRADITSFEIVPRDPDTYKDWQVGDKIIEGDVEYSIIFRCGEIALYKNFRGSCCNVPYTCEELYNLGYRLVLTDAEKQILEEQKKEGWEPQDGDICFIESLTPHVIIYKENKNGHVRSYADFRLNDDYIYDFVFETCRIDDIKKCRPATEQEKHWLFNALAKKGKRWNAERKRLESIAPVPYKLRKFEPVLVRDKADQSWGCDVYLKPGNMTYPYECANGLWRLCIPLNEDTEHLLGTKEDCNHHTITQ